MKKYHPDIVSPYVSQTIRVGQSKITESHVLYVSYTKADSQKKDRSLVYFPFVGDPAPFDSSEDFIKWYTARQEGEGVLQSLVLWSGGIAGLIAVAICSGTPVGIRSLAR